MPRLHLHHHEMEQFATYSVLHHRIGAFEPPLLTGAALHFQHHLQYLKYAEPLELTASYPLDLSTKRYHQDAPITPPCTPSPGNKRSTVDTASTTSPLSTSSIPELPTKKNKNALTSSQAKKTKVTRKLNFDDDTSSPVSGTIIRELDPGETLVVRKGDIDPAFNVVEITEEAKAELAKIENHIGDYVCRLCRELYEDAFGLAQHRCSRIVHVEYRCPECDKVFNCPANLASHRRWHKPKQATNGKDLNSHHHQVVKSESADSMGETGDSGGEQFPCGECGKRFRRLAYLRKHQTVHQQD